MSESPTIPQRLVHLQTRRDLLSSEMSFRGEKCHVVKDPLSLQYYHLAPEQRFVLGLLDGKTSLESIREKVQAEFPSHHIAVAEIQALIVDLHNKGLLLQNRYGAHDSLYTRFNTQQRQRLVRVLLSPFFIKFPGLDPSRLLAILYPWFGFLFGWSGFAFVSLVVAISSAQLGYRYDDLLRRIPSFVQFFGWPNIVLLWLSLGLTKVIHELGHALACIRFGCRCHAIGFAMIVFSPTMYCDASDAWMIPSKWKRIAIAMSGMYVEIVLSAIAILFWCNAHEGTLSNLALNIFFVSTFSTVVFNANPLIKFDGYFVLSDFLEIPNLKEKSSATIQQGLAWAMGVTLPVNPFLPKSGRFAFGSYAILSTFYGWFVLFSISLGMYEMLKPYRLGSIGVTIGAFSFLVSIMGMTYGGWKMLARAQDNSWNRKRFILATTVVLLLIAIASLPIPFHVVAPFTMQPVNGRTISNVSPGVLASVQAVIGSQVKRGDAIASMENEAFEDKVRELNIELEVARAKLNLHASLDEHEDYAVTEDTIRKLERQVNEWTFKLKHLRIESPIDGIIYACVRRPSPTIEAIGESMPKWSGTIIDSFNIGAFLEEGTPVCILAPDRTFEAILVLDQHDRQDVQVDQGVRLLCDSFPTQIISGKVAEVSERYLEFAPRSLSNKQGGGLPTTTDSQGRERLGSIAYQIRISLADSHLPLKVGMRGNAKILVVHRSLIGWSWRFLRQTVFFRL